MTIHLFKIKKCFLLLSFLALWIPSFSQLTLVEWNFPNNPDDAIADIAIPANAAQTIYTVGGTAAVGYGTNTGATTRSAWCTGWNSGLNLKWWELQANTTGYFNLEISSKQRSSSTGPRDFALQYKIGAGGAWTAVPAAPAIVVADNFNAGVLTNVVLPAACENQPSVYFRWIMSTNTSVALGTVASGGSSRIDDVNLSANDANDHYRTVASGSWNNPAIWEVSPTATWPGVPATIAPSKYSKTITVRNTHLVTINSNVSLDETTIQVGGGVNYNSGILTINDGTGVDLQVDGFFTDGGASAVVWAGAAPRWALGAAGTYTKTEGTNATNWQNNYNGGISTIPATGSWVIHKTPSSASAPSLTSTGMFYPNLTIMNSAGGTWVTAVGSTFTGSLGFPTIKGTLDIGGTLGFGSVDFLCDNTNASCVQVLGNMIIRAGSNLRNYGTGFELYADLTVDGSTGYDATDARKFKFSGGTVQNISGTGTLATFGVYQMQVTKTANDINLNRPVKVDNNLDLQNGIINSTMTNIMVIEDNATATNTSNVSFVRGPVRKLGDEAFVFPVGKNNDYQAIGYSAGPPVGGSVTFWTENFSTVSGWSLANVLGPEGSDPNFFQITANEGGVTPPGCGVANNGNKTLHVTSVFNPPGGAAYDAGGLCGLLFCPQTNRRAESPLINCSGQSNITLSFNYIGNGQGLIDNASLWYYDGAAWSMIAPSLKSTVCGSGQGRWTAYSILLPASANNNPGIKIGFKWENNDDGVGTDPSFAVDDISLSVPGGVIESYTAEYFYSNPQVPYGNSLLPNLATISNCEYWILTRDIGTSNRFVTLYFDANSCGYQNTPANLLVANYNTGNWYDRGNGGFTASSVTTLAAQTVYGPFTLGSVVPLPIELVKFDAKYNGKTVDLNWVTASEMNNDYFTVERTKDGSDFITITKVPGAGTTTTARYYSANDDAPQTGISYYRLMQTDFDGKSSFSKLVPVKIHANEFAIDYLFANQTSNEIYFTLNNINGNIIVDIIDVLGRTVISQKLSSPGENEIFKLNVSLLKRGVYTLRISNSENVLNKKFFY
jgi:hypothetical protein